MEEQLAMSLFELIKLVLAAGIMAYAYFFLRSAERMDDRKPWEYLYLSSLFLFMVTMLGVLATRNPAAFDTHFFRSMGKFFELSLLGCLLLSFIFQHQLLATRRVLLLQRAPGPSWLERLRQRREERERKSETKSLRLIGIEIEAPERAPDQPQAEEQPQTEEQAQADEPLSPEAQRAVERAKGLIASIEELLRTNSGRIERERASALLGRIDELAKLCAQPRPDAAAINALIEETLRGGPQPPRPN